MKTRQVIKELRLKKGMAQEDLASKTEIHTPPFPIKQLPIQIECINLKISLIKSLD
ncbi:hypothetical protein [Marinoscillum pacificum]|uniref:hypothetical protein n=1 Tax=Marinoscillum pacificum TaxID=392723 RepID=UPI002157B55C|nr:hypothetical protein [Marinoscillum pacificum]